MTKLRHDAWQDAHRDVVRASQRRYNRRIFRGVVVECATDGCERRFLRSRHQSRRVFCDGCFLVYYGARDLGLRKPEVAA